MKGIAKEESEKIKQLKKLNKELVTEYNSLHETNKKLSEELSKKDAEHQEEMKRLYDLIHEISVERDRLKEGVSVQPSYISPSNDLLRENKQMKAFLRSIMSTCDTIRELEIA